jgi:hypothetical protein
VETFGKFKKLLGALKWFLFPKSSFDVDGEVLLGLTKQDSLLVQRATESYVSQGSF